MSSRDRHPLFSTEEYKRLKSCEEEEVYSWKWWGPYVSERAWGTVREDYSANGDAWSYFPFEHAHIRAYRWGEDGIAGICDCFQYLSLSFAFWNGKDPILKERLYGLTSSQGNHGEDVKELYYYLDATPTFSYGKYLYKYPQEKFPYERLLKENQKRSVQDLEYELIDTKVFEKNKYFDIFIEYAKNDVDDIYVKIEAFNRSDQEAELHILPQLNFRNRWEFSDEEVPKPVLFESKDHPGCIVADDKDIRAPRRLSIAYQLNQWFLYGSKEVPTYFTENETNKEKLKKGKNASPYTKEGFHEKVIHNKDSVNPEKKGTKGCFHYSFEKIAPKKSETIYLRFTKQAIEDPLKNAEKVFLQRKKEADHFYHYIQKNTSNEDRKNIQRQAFAGMIWSKQAYLFDVSQWLVGDSKKNPPPKEREYVRNNHWRHLNSTLIFSMPDKWEYPWFAAWDLALHTVAFSLIDLQFAKEQLLSLLQDKFQHPNGQIPAYEWEFSDVNPPIQAWAALKIYEKEKEEFGFEDIPFLEKCFHRLLLNFCWWINVIDKSGRNVFEGGFLGLDNITIFDRSDLKGNQGHLDEADGSGWIAMFCLNLMKMALILSHKNPNYQSLAIKFFEHFVYVAAALRKGYWRDYDMLNKEDHFFYSHFLYDNGTKEELKIRSLVGIIPFFAGLSVEKEEIRSLTSFLQGFDWFRENRPNLIKTCVHEVAKDGDSIYVFSLLHPDEMEKFLCYSWDEEEFLSDYGLRSVSKYHEKNPFKHEKIQLKYEPGESLEKIKGGNSNWRGPIWMPVNYLFVQSLQTFARAFPKLRVKVKNKDSTSLQIMAQEYAKRLIKIFQKDESGRRAVFGDYEKMQKDPHFEDYLLFFEHYHGDSGRGLGASHQTGWSGLIANLIQEYPE